ncbi:RNA processing factor [Lithospermum erythrorhizon]|uniref:tRNA (guanine-N(7)-)-methyltransferase non-catalytic subunit n=1 Tax=Lithospermum erythrorhizon TaxID=34254 RepID=A0AAV3PTE0_LITER
MEEINMEEGDQTREMGVAPALIALDPTHQYVSVSVGSDLRVFNLREGCGVSLVDPTGGCMHKDAVRAIRFSGNGKLFVSAGDDKLVKVWSTESWHCIATVTSEKRVSAVAIDKGGRYVCYADKFGVVYALDTECFDGTNASLNKKAVPLLAHYCSIITSLEFSPDGKFILSADRDFKIRVTVFPKNPLDGAHEIQSFCLGHTEFVSCLAFVCNVDFPQGNLVSGSGDSTVRLWDFTTGSLLDTCDVGSKAGLSQSNGKDAEVSPAVTDLCPNFDGSLVAVAIQNLSGILLLSCNLSFRKLSIAKVVSIPGETCIPSSLGAALSEPMLWMIMGASSLRVSDSASLARVRVVSNFSGVTEQEATVVDDSDIPGGQPLLQKLQGSLSVGEEAISAAAEAVKTALRNLLIKKQYSTERREHRKCGRNDKKIKK